jgi:ribonucleoside-diphosphate reductase alpha chain
MTKPKIIEPKLSKNGLEVAKKRYLRTDMEGKTLETVGEMLWRVAYHMAKPEVNWAGNGIVMETANKFYERMVSLKMVCAGKAMFEAGNPGGTGQLSSCFVLPIEDSIGKIFKTLGDAAVVHKNNGGTGFNFSKIRPHGDKVKNVPGASSGPVDFLKAYSAALSQILQGAKRQGANIGILNADHPDIEEFIDLKDQDGTIKNFNVSVGVTDAFMQAVEDDKYWNLINPRNGEVIKRLKAKTLFNKIAEQAWKSGDPGLMFLDNTERGNTVPNFGKLDATNPCVTGDTMVATDKGWERIDQLINRGEVSVIVDTRVIGGQKIETKKTTKVIKTGDKQVYKIETKSGYSVKATADHKIMTIDGWKVVELLRVGDKVLIQSGQGEFEKASKFLFEWDNKKVGDNGRNYQFQLPTNWNKKLGVLLGWLVGDGFIREETEKHGAYLNLTFGRGKEKARDYFLELLSKWCGSARAHEATERTRQIFVSSKFVVDYFIRLGVGTRRSEYKRVPNSIFTAPKDVVIGFLQGLFSSDGTVGYVKNKSAYVRLTSKSRDLLTDVQLLLLQLGIKARIYDRSRGERINLFPEYKNANGEIKRYGSDGALWELEISKDVVIKFVDEIGFLFDMHSDKVELLRSKDYYSTKWDDAITKIEKLGVEPVYDLTEPETHSFIANGIVVHNCGEIALFPYESCNLTSIDLARHLKSNTIDWDDLKETVKLGVRFLDNMIEVNAYPVPEIEATVKNGNRRIGLGVMGFAHVLYRMGIPYNSSEAVKLAKELAKFIYDNAAEASAELAEIRGNFNNWDLSIYPAKGQPMRNCAVTMIAPTGTISILADTSSGIEPVFSLVTKRRTFYEDDKSNHSTKEMYMVDPVFEEYIGKRKEVLEQVANGDYSGLTAEEKKLFVTTHQIKPEWHVKIQAAWQKYFDNSISKTVNFGHDATVDDVKETYMMAWKMGCKGVTIYRDGSKDDQVLSVGQTVGQSENSENQSFRESVDQKDDLVCPECGGKLHKQDGCSKCIDCGYSVCG